MTMCGEPIDAATLARATLRWFDDYAGGGILTTDTELRIRSWNQWLVDATDIAAQTAIGRPLFEVIPTLRERGFDLYYDEALRGEIKVLSHALHRYILPTGGAAGEQMPQSGRIAPLVDAGVIVGTITVIEEQRHQVLAQMKTKPGARSIRFAPGGRYGFVLNAKQSSVHIFDSASNRMLHEVKVVNSPDQVTFSSVFAFVRSLDTENVYMLRLGELDKEVDVTEFPGGQAPPGQGSTPIRADSIVLAPEGNSVIVANPVDKVLYYYTEGMAAPMGNFQNYRREPLAVMVVDRSLREIKPGVYSTTIKLPASGRYDVAFLNDSPRVSHCFSLMADANPLLKERKSVALSIEHQVKEKELPIGQDFTFRFKLVETATGNPKPDLKDVRVLTFLSPGVWQRRDMATSVGHGVYELKIKVPEAGVYMLFVESSSMGVGFQDLPYLMLHTAEEQK